jgi:uncharacterized protein
MQDFTIYNPDTFITMPWRNGLGQTIELLKQELPNDKEFAWRLSMADVTNDGEFSDFAGYDRTLVMLNGNGMTLDFGDGNPQHLRTPLSLVQFTGEQATVANLHDGPIRDFNVMTRRDYCSARVTTYRNQQAQVIGGGADDFLVYSFDAGTKVELASGEAITLPEAHLWHCHAAKSSIRLSGASYIVIQIVFN